MAHNSPYPPGDPRSRDVLAGSGVPVWSPTTTESFLLEKTFLEDVVRPLVRALVHSRLQTSGVAPGGPPGASLQRDLLNIRDSLLRNIPAPGSGYSGAAAGVHVPGASAVGAHAAVPQAAAHAAGDQSYHVTGATPGLGQGTSSQRADAATAAAAAAAAAADIGIGADEITDHDMSMAIDAEVSAASFDVSELGAHRKLTPALRKRTATRHRTCGGCGIPHNNKFRRGPHGPGTLCDKCGSKWKKVTDAAKLDAQLASGAFAEQHRQQTSSFTNSSMAGPSGTSAAMDSYMAGDGNGLDDLDEDELDFDGEEHHGTQGRAEPGHRPSFREDGLDESNLNLTGGAEESHAQNGRSSRDGSVGPTAGGAGASPGGSDLSHAAAAAAAAGATAAAAAAPPRSSSLAREGSGGGAQHSSHYSNSSRTNSPGPSGSHHPQAQQHAQHSSAGSGRPTPPGGPPPGSAAHGAPPRGGGGAEGGDGGGRDDDDEGTPGSAPAAGAVSHAAAQAFLTAMHQRNSSHLN
ncbi:hypothetical protein V8E36_001818 [Tilletia maclaganii]